MRNTTFSLALVSGFTVYLVKWLVFTNAVLSIRYLKLYGFVFKNHCRVSSDKLVEVHNLIKDVIFYISVIGIYLNPLFGTKAQGLRLELLIFNII